MGRSERGRWRRRRRRRKSLQTLDNKVSGHLEGSLYVPQSPTWTQLAHCVCGTENVLAGVTWQWEDPHCQQQLDEFPGWTLTVL